MMPADPTTCPYCNAHLPVGLPSLAGRGVICPRCQEVVPFAAAGNPVAALEVQTKPNLPARPDNKRIAAYVFALMVVMAGIGFAFAWYTTSTRRARDQLADQTDPETLRSVMLNP